MRENHKYSTYLSLIHLHIFIFFDLLKVSTPNLCKIPLAVAYKLIQAPTSMISRIHLDWGSQLNDEWDPTCSRLQHDSGSNLNGGTHVLLQFVFTLFFISFSNWIQFHHIWMNHNIKFATTITSIIVVTYNHCHCNQNMWPLSLQLLSQPTTIFIAINNHINCFHMLLYFFLWFYPTKSSV